MSKLFISYRRANWSFTYWLREELEKILEAEIFVDFSGIDESNFENSLLRNLRDSDAVLLIVTEHTFAPDRIFRESDWVRREIREALALNKPIALALHEGKTPPSDPTQLPSDILEIQKRQGIDFYPRYFKAGVHEMASFITRISSLKLKRDAAPAPSELPTATNQSPSIRFNLAISLAEAGDYKRALELLEALEAEKYQPRMFKLADTIADVQKFLQEEARRWEAGEAYDEIEALARLNVKRAQGAWMQFKQMYPEFTEDPAELDKKLTPPVGEGFKPSPTPIKQSQSIGAQTPPVRAHSSMPLRELTDITRRILGDPFEWIEIPAGEFLYGKDRQKLSLPTYAIAKYPITYSQFQKFVDDPKGFKNSQWWEGLAADADHKKQAGDQNWKIADHPRENVNWYDAMAFCRWLSHQLWGVVGARHASPLQEDYDPMNPFTWLVRLPIEQEWEKAARGTDGQEYPWGDGFDSKKANTNESGLKKTSPVTAYPQGASPYGVLDMAGNVWEWCLTEYGSERNDDISNSNSRVIRGGSWDFSGDDARAVVRFLSLPDSRVGSLGFRVLCVSPFSLQEQQGR